MKSIIDWLRNDPWGPEIFGLILEFIILLLLIPVFKLAWRWVVESSRLNEKVDILFAKFRRLQEAAVELVRVIDRLIRHRELLRRDYGISEAEFSLLFDSDDYNENDIPPRLSDGEREEVKTVVREIRFATISFNELASEIIYYLSEFSEANNVIEARDASERLFEAIRELNRVQLRETLLSRFEKEIHPAVAELLSVHLYVGRRKYIWDHSYVVTEEKNAQQQFLTGKW